MTTLNVPGGRHYSRRSLALRGTALIVIVAAAVVAAVAVNSRTSASAPLVSTVLPAAVGPVEPGTPVQYRGVTVGTLDAVKPTATGSELTLRLDDARLPEIPAGVQTRLLPLTLFGNEYIDLVPPANAGSAGGLRPGAVLAADTSSGIVNLYQAYTKFSQLLTAVDPAQLDMALTAVADALRGHGAEIGRIIDELHSATSTMDPRIARLAAQLPAAAEMTKNLASSAPDLMGLMRNAVAESRTVLAERQNIGALLTAGTTLAGQARTLMDKDGGEAVSMLYKTAPLSSVLASNPSGITSLLGGASDFLNGATKVFSTGRFNIQAQLSLDDPYPYTSADCPRYYGASGLRCGSSGTSTSASVSDLLTGGLQSTKGTGSR